MLILYYNSSKLFKIGRYFQLKSNTPLALCSNIVYKFIYSWDMNLTHYGMSIRHSITQVTKYLDFNGIQKSRIKDRILFCVIRSDVLYNLSRLL